MGFFDFVGRAGSKLFGGDHIDERAIQEYLFGLGVKVRGLSVIAHQPQKMISVVGRVDSLEDKEKLILAAGNVRGVERVDDRLRVDQPKADEPEAAEVPPVTSVEEVEEPPPEEQPISQFYTVQSGDTLSGIAKQFYGNAGKYPVIFEANKPMLSDPDKIYPGQVLRIPPVD